jgi:ketosteroid isomerase-like protein
MIRSPGSLSALFVIASAAGLLASACGGQPAASPSATAGRVDTTAIAATIRQRDADWVKAAATHNADAWVAFDSNDAVVLPPNEPTASDKATIKKSVTGLLALPALNLTWAPANVVVASSGDLGYSYGTYKLTAEDDKGVPFTDSGKNVEIWKKQADGSWKCSIDTWSSDVPVPPAK